MVFFVVGEIFVANFSLNLKKKRFLWQKATRHN